MLRSLKSLGAGRRRPEARVGVCLHRALAVAVSSSASSEPRPRVRVVELPTEAGAQAKALARAVADLGVKGAPADVVLPLGSYSLLQIERPAVDETELAEAARWQVKSQLDYPVDDAVLRVFDAPQPKDRHRAPQLNVVAAPARAVRELTALVKRAGLRPSKVTIAELAICNLAARAVEDTGPVATVFLNARQGVIQVTWHKSLYLSRRVDYGLGSVRPADPMATGIHTVLPLELRRTVDYFGSHFGAGQVRRVLAGPAEEHFMQFMSEASEFTGLAMQPLELPAELETDSAKSADYGTSEAYLAVSAALGTREPAGRAEVA